jgi:hypothetical protein
MNFKRLYERTHLKEEVRRNIMAVERFLQANRTDYSYTSFLNWLKNINPEEFVEFKDNVDRNASFYYVAAAACLDVLHADPSTYPGLEDNIKSEKSKNPEIFEKNYNWIAPTMENIYQEPIFLKKNTQHLKIGQAVLLQQVKKERNLLMILIFLKQDQNQKWKKLKQIFWVIFL